ncbi:cellulase family glycosylhydrolase [Mycolicibacterium bacteremicum]|uniref:cellulase family glycosylhydrolase n=1 Tax=Mycolicibacterium bacteremicum TaxID=564198 RepID=UPI0026F0C1EE|nr:cellulase family glycosylhydrolase [Mycolicibacterium bacteremicum]
MTLVGATVQVGAPPTPADETRQVSAQVALAAAIDTSPNAVGIAESELYFMTPEEVDVALDTMQSLGVTQVRIFVPWRAVEPAPGVYNWTEVDKVVDAAYERGIAVLGAVTSTPTWASDVQDSAYGAPRNPEDFGSFMGALAERYGAGEGDPETARISAYEIWNEPQSFVFWNPRPDPAAYTELLKAGYTAVKEVDPTGTVVGGVVTAGLSWGGVNINPVEFVQTMYESGAAGYFDALSYHPYNYDWKFGDGFGNEISAVGQLQAMQALMEQYGDGDKEVWTSEYGLPTSYVSEAQQAEFIGDFLDTWSELDGVGPQFIYSLVDRNSASTEVEDTWGLFRDDYTPKQAAAVVQAWIAENGPVPDGGIPVDELPTLDELPTVEVPTDPVTEEPTAPVDPVAEAVANWQAALAEAAANWAAAWGQTTTPTATTQPVSATTEPTTALRTATAPAEEVAPVDEAELAQVVTEATAATEEDAATDTTEEVDAPSSATDPALESTDSSRAAVIEATQAEPEDATTATETDAADTADATVTDDTATDDTDAATTESSQESADSSTDADSTDATSESDSASSTGSSATGTTGSSSTSSDSGSSSSDSSSSSSDSGSSSTE